MAFVPKSRRAKFELTLRIIDLNNVPLVSGSSLIKWHLPSSTSAEHRGRTQKAPIKDHRVAYDYTKKLPVRLSVDKENRLQECMVDLEVIQEYSVSGRGERIVLGKVRLNLAEYVDGEMGEEGVVRRYLMQESKINSTVKLGIAMRHLEGVRDYIAPVLKTAPVFGGIAGIITSSEPVTATNGESGAQDNVEGPVPTLSLNSREAGEMQDMYRRTLAAYWASQPGELKADDCIEDIFAGGDGWGKHGPPSSIQQQTTPRMNGGESGSSTPTQSADIRRDNGRVTSEGTSRGFFSKSRTHGQESRHNGTGRHHTRTFGASKHKVPRKVPGELDELEVREDLRSWRVGESAVT